MKKITFLLLVGLLAPAFAKIVATVVVSPPSGYTVTYYYRLNATLNIPGYGVLPLGIENTTTVTDGQPFTTTATIPVDVEITYTNTTYATFEVTYYIFAKNDDVPTTMTNTTASAIVKTALLLPGQNIDYHYDVNLGSYFGKSSFSVKAGFNGTILPIVGLAGAGAVAYLKRKLSRRN
ncbi:hypothetical protein EYM_01670 [Ignicoccus islandicus DSM 13165]|uniref:Uncharacterized protein n=1 Tax=Ignicoccus islandicus DSM 13165 TaxID=940295 RepID=A0A0U3FQR6_9CREN|nr:hypothetical protein [Ignicoccus islandicus]ALU12231.1 hypothetical protein EYM_01670 [Ignicoccus islandicus DSM 13165]